MLSFLGYCPFTDLKIMAASLDNTHAVSDGGKCSICYDHFKAPR